MGLRNGKSYLHGLCDGRKVVFDGKEIEDLTREPGFCDGASAVAQFYDFQNRPELRDIMTYETPEGEIAGTAFMQPRSKEDLRRRSAAYTAWAEVTCGFMGRSPDYMSTALAILGAYDPIFHRMESKSQGRAEAIYLKARREDLCYTHTFAEPFKVPGPPSKGEADKARRPSFAIRETKEGLVVNGARGLATLAPFSDWNLDTGAVGAPPSEGGTRLFSFVVPVNARGLKWICRDQLSLDRSYASSPMASRADEMDCLAVYEDCLIPWEDVMLYSKEYPERPGMRLFMAGLHYQVIFRVIAKTRFMVGLAHLLAESSRVSQFINIQERIGEMVSFLQTLESFVLAAIEGAIIDPETGLCFPHPETVGVAGIWWGQFHRKMVNHLLDIGGGRYMSTPQEATIDALGQALEDYVRGTSDSGRGNVALHRLAWDIAGSSWGVRQDLYERFHFGDLTLRKVGAGLGFDKSQAIAMVRRILDVAPQEGERFPHIAPKPEAS